MNLSIMQDKGPWTFTEEQIVNIKHFSVEDMNKFYFDNYDIIMRMAKGFVHKESMYGCHIYDINDLLQQVYIDLPYYSFRSRHALYISIVKGSFKFVNYGGIKARNRAIPEYELNSLSINNDDEKDLLLDYYTSYEEKAFDFVNIDKEREEKDKQVTEYLEKTITNKHHLNAMFCKLFTDIPESELKGNEYELYTKCER